jgi:hypothetical protein
MATSICGPPMHPSLSGEVSNGITTAAGVFKIHVLEDEHRKEFSLCAVRDPGNSQSSRVFDAQSAEGTHAGGNRGSFFLVGLE